MKNFILLGTLLSSACIGTIELSAQEGPPDATIELRQGSIELYRVPSDARPLSGRSVASERDREQGHVVVLQFARRLSVSDQQLLKDLGVEILGFVKDTNYLARSRDKGIETIASRFRSVNPLTHVGQLDAQNKIASSVQEEVRMKQQERAPLPPHAAQPPETLLQVVLWPKVDFEAVRRKLAETGRIVSAQPSTMTIELSVTSPDALERIAGDPRVQSIEPVRRPSLQNDTIRRNLEVAKAWGDPHRLSGAGVRVGIWDGWHVAGDHSRLKNRVIYGDKLFGAGAPTNRKHATHVAGIIAASPPPPQSNASMGRSIVSVEKQHEVLAGILTDGTPMLGRPRVLSSDAEDEKEQYAGVAPGSTLYSFDFENSEEELINILLEKPDSIHVANNSWVYIPRMKTECDLFGSYDSHSQTYDGVSSGFVGDKKIRRIPIVFAAGNERHRDLFNCKSDRQPNQLSYRTILPPATAKNVITVGAVYSEDDAMTEFSNWGPTNDGRLKPEIVAPGCRGINKETRGIISTIPEDEFGRDCGTSMAAPAVTGVIALMMEKMDIEKLDRTTIPPSTFKALLVHGAEDLEPAGPDYKFGFGRIRLLRTLDAIAQRAFHPGQLDVEKDELTKRMHVPPNAKMIRATLAWDDRPSLSLGAGGLVNDIDLELRDPNNQAYFPLVLSANPGEEENLATPQVDNRNVVEQIIVKQPMTGEWKIIMRGAKLALPPQPVSIVLSVEQ